MEYSSTRELKLKIKLHMKVCKFPPKNAEVRKPKVKSMTLKEVLQYSRGEWKGGYTMSKCHKIWPKMSKMSN